MEACSTSHDVFFCIETTLIIVNVKAVDVAVNVKAVDVWDVDVAEVRLFASGLSSCRFSSGALLQKHKVTRRSFTNAQSHIPIEFIILCAKGKA